MKVTCKVQWKSLDIGVRKHLLQIEGPTIQRAILKDAQELQGRVLKMTPIGTKKPKYRGQKPGYGPLRNAVVAWPFKKKIPGRVSAFVAVDQKIAWYGRMVEYGHRIGTRKTGYLQKMKKKGSRLKPGGYYAGAGALYSTRKGTFIERMLGMHSFKWVSAHPFFGPAKKGFQMKNLLRELRRIIQQTNFEPGYHHYEGM